MKVALEELLEAQIEPPDSSVPSLLPLASPSSSASRRAAVVADPRALQSLIDRLLDRAGISQSELARRLGISRQSVNQYRSARKLRPSLVAFVKLAEACGARVWVEFPDSPL